MNASPCRPASRVLVGIGGDDRAAALCAKVRRLGIAVEGVAGHDETITVEFHALAVVEHPAARNDEAVRAFVCPSVAETMSTARAGE